MKLLRFNLILFAICALLFFACNKDNDDDDDNNNDNEIIYECVDYEGYVYDTVRIGNQTWMAENLRTRHYNDGSEIFQIVDDDDWSEVYHAERGAYADYNNDTSYSEIYGRLYNFFTEEESLGICPCGWHMPSDDEWKEMEIYLGMTQEQADSQGYRGVDIGSKLAGFSDLWYSGNLEENDVFGTSGFNAIPAGFRCDSNYAVRQLTRMWSTTLTSTACYPEDSIYPIDREIYYSSTSVNRQGCSKCFLYSIRCVRDH